MFIGEPKSVAISLTLLKVTLIATSVTPLILAVSLGHPIYIFTFIRLTISVKFDSFPMLQPVFEHSSKHISVDLLVNTLPIRQTTPPFPIIVLNKLIRLRLSAGKTEPIKFALPMFFIVLELTNIEVAIGINLNSFAVLLIVVEISLVNLSFLLDIYAFSFSTFALHITKVDLAVGLDKL